MVREFPGPPGYPPIREYAHEFIAPPVWSRWDESMGQMYVPEEQAIVLQAIADRIIANPKPEWVAVERELEALARRRTGG